MVKDAWAGTWSIGYNSQVDSNNLPERFDLTYKGSGQMEFAVNR